MVNALKYDEEPKYQDIINLIIHEILKLDAIPSANNYDWVSNPFFFKKL